MCDSLPPQSIACSSHGQCMIDSCICNDGWSSYGDFSPFGNDCSINILSVTILSSISIALGFLIACLYSRYIFFKVTSLLSMYGTADISTPNISFALSLLFSTICGIIYCAFKVVDVSYTVGDSYISTIFLALFYGSFLNGLLLYLYVCLSFLGGFQRMMPAETRKNFQRNVSFTNKKIKVLLYFNVFMTLLYFITVFVPAENQYIVGLVYYILTGIFFMFYISLYNPLVKVVTEELGKAVMGKRPSTPPQGQLSLKKVHDSSILSSKNEEVANNIDSHEAAGRELQLKKIYQALVFGRISVNISMIIFATFFILIGSWKYLLMKVTYINIIFTFLFPILISIPLLLSVSKESPKIVGNFTTRIIRILSSDRSSTKGTSVTKQVISAQKLNADSSNFTSGVDNKTFGIRESIKFSASVVESSAIVEQVEQQLKDDVIVENL